LKGGRGGTDRDYYLVSSREKSLTPYNPQERERKGKKSLFSKSGPRKEKRRATRISPYRKRKKEKGNSGREQSYLPGEEGGKEGRRKGRASTVLPGPREEKKGGFWAHEALYAPRKKERGIRSYSMTKRRGKVLAGMGTTELPRKGREKTNT